MIWSLGQSRGGIEMRRDGMEMPCDGTEMSHRGTERPCAGVEMGRGGTNPRQSESQTRIQKTENIRRGCGSYLLARRDWQQTP